MKPLAWKQSLIPAMLSLACMLASCGGGNQPPAAASVAVRVSPSSASLRQGTTQQFTATLTGSTSTLVSWSVQEAGGGSVSSGGLYTAPVANGTFHVIATSQSDPTKSAFAIVTVPPVPPVAVGISPRSVNLAPGLTQQFTATVAGSANTAVTWSVQELSGGTITNAGMYAAPATTGTFHIIATSEADPTKSATATVTVAVPTTGQFAATGSMAMARVNHTATRLLDGRVLVTGGLHEDIIGMAWGPAYALSTAELYNPTAGSFTPAGTMNHPRAAHTATLLGDGTVLIAGGVHGNGSFAAEVYDPASNTFTLAGDMLIARSSHVATRLDNGNVLITGGFPDDGSSPLVTLAEIYEPTTRKFSSAGQMQVPRAFHSASLLLNGQVLLAGGYTDRNGQVTFTAELYDPATGMFFVTGNMSSPRVWFVAAVLLDGKVLVAGGENGATAEVYDPAIGSFFLTGAMNSPRQEFAAVTLLDGSVLVCGGGAYPSSFMAELFHPGSGTFAATGSMGADRIGHTATLLTDGRVLVVGGWNNDSIILAWVELYTP